MRRSFFHFKSSWDEVLLDCRLVRGRSIFSALESATISLDRALAKWAWGLGFSVIVLMIGCEQELLPTVELFANPFACHFVY